VSNESNEASESNEAPNEEAQSGKVRDPARLLTSIVLALIALSFLWYLVADRITPSTSQARVSGFVIPIVPEVSGVVTEVGVGLNQRVSAGDLLVQIDRDRYELAVTKAEAEFEQAGQAVGADTGGLAAAEAQLAEARTHLDYVRHDAQLTFTLEAEGVASKRRADRARSRVEEAEAQFQQARAEVDKARSQLGSVGSDNPRLRSALAMLRQARIDLGHSTLRAPLDGGVTNVRVDVGRYASAGQPLMTFISTTDVWVEAHMRENCLGRIEPGDAVEIALDAAPGRVFSGQVSSTGFGVEWGQATEPGKLPKLSNSRDWLREPQRFPLIIGFTDDSSRGLRREGGQADVIVYTGNNFVLNALGKLWIRAMSLLSYVY